MEPLQEIKPATSINRDPLPKAVYSFAPSRVLFLNTQQRCGADVAVHLSLLTHFLPDRTRGYLISNSQADDVAEIRGLLTSSLQSGGKVWFSPFGRSSYNSSFLGSIAVFLALLYSLLRAATLIRHCRIDIIHATDRPRDTFFATILGYLTQTPVVIQMHSNCGPHLSRLTREGLRRATAVFAVSSYLRDELITSGLSPERVHVLHNSTDADHFAPQPFREMRSAVRKRYRIPDNAPLVGIVARINPWKGQKELIDAVADLSLRFPNLHLLILGGGTAEYERTMKEYAIQKGVDDLVRFAGFHKDVRPFLAALDIFALPSYEEPFGLAITEAMAMALPVIACRSGGVPEIITHERDGYLIAPRSADALSDAIAVLLGDADLRALLGQRARRTIQERFRPEVQAERASDLYESLLPCLQHRW